MVYVNFVNLTLCPAGLKLINIYLNHMLPTCEIKGSENFQEAPPHTEVLNTNQISVYWEVKMCKILKHFWPTWYSLYYRGGDVLRKSKCKHTSRWWSQSKPGSCSIVLINRSLVLNWLNWQRENAEVPGPGSGSKLDYSRHRDVQVACWNKYIHLRKEDFFKKQTCTIDQN